MTEVLFARLDEMLAGDASLQAQISALSPSITITDDNATNASVFPVWSAVNSGNLSVAKVSSTKLSFNPNLGLLNSTLMQTTALIGGSLSSSVLTLQSTTGVGTTDGINFRTGNNGVNLAMQIISNGFVGIGPAGIAPDALLSLNRNTGAPVTFANPPAFHLIGADTLQNQVAMDAYGNRNVFNMRQANGTLAAKTASSTANQLAAFLAQGWNTSAYVVSAQFGFYPTETWTTGASGTEIRWLTTPTGSTTSTESVRFQASGGLSIGAAAIAADPGIGSLNVSNVVAIGAAQLGINQLSVTNSNTNLLALVNTATPATTAGAGIQALNSGLPTAADQRLMFMLGGVLDGTTVRNTAGFSVFSGQAWTAGSAQGSYVDIQTTPNASASRASAMRIQNSGGVSIGALAIAVDPGVGSLNMTGGLNVAALGETPGAGNIMFKPGSSVTPILNGTATFQATSNTSFTIKYKGSDGTVRSGSITLT